MNVQISVFCFKWSSYALCMMSQRHFSSFIKENNYKYDYMTKNINNSSRDETTIIILKAENLQISFINI